MSRTATLLARRTIASLIAHGARHRLRLLKLIATETLARVLSARILEALSIAVFGAAGRGHGLAPPGECDTVQGAGIEVVGVASS